MSLEITIYALYVEIGELINKEDIGKRRSGQDLMHESLFGMRLF
jgi:hypothetical protein